MNPVDAVAQGVALAGIVGLAAWAISSIVVTVLDLVGLTWSIRGEERRHRDDPPAVVRPGARW